MKKIRKVSLSILIFLLTCFVFLNAINVFANEGEFALYGATYKVKEVVDDYDLGFGITYQREIATSSVTQGGLSTGFSLNVDSPQQAHVLTVKPSEDVELVPYTFLDGGQWHALTVKKAALQYEATHPGYRVVAAVNGDFFKINNYVKASTGVTISQGEFYKANSHHGGVKTLAIKNSGEGKQLFTANIADSYPTLSIYDKEGNIIKKIWIDKVNKEPGDNETSVFYAERATNFERDLNYVKVNNAWFVKSGLYGVTSSKGSFYGVGNITEFLTNEIDVKLNQFAIKTNNKEINDLLATDVKIRVQYEYKDPSVEGIENFIGFPYQLVDNGEYVGKKHPDNNNVLYRHPRTIIGQKENGDVVLAVVDGRQENKKMYGLSAVEMSTFMAAHGCVDVWNLDGGGSSTLIVRKQNGWTFGNENNGFNKDNSDWYVTNNPSDGGERSDGNHLLVVVKLPDVKFEIKSATETSLTLNAALLTDLEKYNKLFVLLGDKYYLVENGEVTIPGLKKNTEYEVYLYAQQGDKYINLMTKRSYFTSKSVPTSIEIMVSLYERNGEEQILLRYKVDKDEAIRTIVLVGNGDRFLTTSQTVMIQKNAQSYELLNNFEIEINYIANAAFPEESMILENVVIKFETMFIVEEMLYVSNDSIKNLFE